MGELSVNNDNLLINYPSCLRENIRELCLNGKIGLSSVTLNDITIVPHRSIDDQLPALPNYHFIFKVPYAGKRMSWEIIFNPEDLFFAPDFDFNDELFLCSPDVGALAPCVPSLLNWDVHTPTALTNVLNEFLALFKRLHLDKLSKDNVYARFYKEYQLLVQKDQFSPEDVEVYVESNSVHFLISLNVDCSQLSEYTDPADNPSDEMLMNPGRDFVHLRISFLKLDYSKMATTMQLSPRLSQVLEGVYVPEYKKEKSVVEHALYVSKIFEDRMKVVAENFKKKQHYVLYLAAVCATSIVEYDSERFSKCSFLYELDDFLCLVQVEVGPKFPQEKPRVTFSSLYCQENQKCSEVFERYTYYTYLGVDEMITYLLEEIKDGVVKFKNHKH